MPPSLAGGRGGDEVLDGSVDEVPAPPRPPASPALRQSRLNLSLNNS